MIYTSFFTRTSALIRLHFAWTPPDHVLTKTRLLPRLDPIESYDTVRTTNVPAVLSFCPEPVSSLVSCDGRPDTDAKKTIVRSSKSSLDQLSLRESIHSHDGSLSRVRVPIVLRIQCSIQPCAVSICILSTSYGAVWVPGPCTRSVFSEDPRC